jgi:hypothetical protein
LPKIAGPLGVFQRSAVDPKIDGVIAQYFAAAEGRRFIDVEGDRFVNSEAFSDFGYNFANHRCVVQNHLEGLGFNRDLNH